MIRLTRSSRIGGRAAETPRGAARRAIVAALAASFAVLAMGGMSSVAPIGIVLAQTAGTSGPVSLGDLFTGPDSYDLKPGAETKLIEAAAQAFHPRDGCAEKAKFKVIVKRGDPVYRPALGAARRDVIKAVVETQMPSNRTEFSYEIGSNDDVQVDYERMRDREKPKLDTNSVPRKGTKVKPGDQIVVTMVARDDATSWQTGIQRIQLLAQNPGGDLLVSAQDYPPVIRPNCEGWPEPRTLVLTYTVPQNPPPIVRLRAIAEDHAGLMDTDVGEFPTGDWYGTIDWRIPFPAGRMWGRLDVTFDYDRQGNLKGRMTGDDHVEAQIPCGPTTTQTPSKLSANLVGQYTPGRNAMSLRITDQKFEQGQFSMCAIAPGGGYQRLSGQPFGGGGPLGQPVLAQLLNNLTVRADGSVEASGEGPVAPASPVQTTLHLKLTLRKAQN